MNPANRVYSSSPLSTDPCHASNNHRPCTRGVAIDPALRACARVAHRLHGRRPPVALLHYARAREMRNAHTKLVVRPLNLYHARKDSPIEITGQDHHHPAHTCALLFHSQKSACGRSGPPHRAGFPDAFRVTADVPAAYSSPSFPPRGDQVAWLCPCLSKTNQSSRKIATRRQGCQGGFVSLANIQRTHLLTGHPATMSPHTPILAYHRTRTDNPKAHG